MIKNPILTGFNPDPCICRKGDDYYIAVSSFEWFPGIPVYHSRDLKNWELYTHILTDDEQVSLKGLPSGKGIWAPCLSYCEEDNLFYAVYGIMRNMNARYFDVDNYLITSENINGPWSEPVYLHSAGFDASLFHDDDGRKWLVALEWETRDDYDKPGEICIAEYDSKNKSLKNSPVRIWRGSTDRGCLEAPHLYKHNNMYYLMCAEGGTGYGHSVTLARSHNPCGPYEADPEKIILSSYTDDYSAREDTDHLRCRFANEKAPLQKAGHASIVETPGGEIYMAFLCARPFFPELRCTLGRETAIQRLEWSNDGWLRACSGKLVSQYCEKSGLPDYPVKAIDEREDFDGEEISADFYSPRIFCKSFTDLKVKKGWLGIRGQEAPTSLYNVSLIAKKLPSVFCDIKTKIDFSPENYHHSAGLVLYYDNMNFAYLQKYYDEKANEQRLCVIRLKNGKREAFENQSVSLESDKYVILALKLRGRTAQFYWGYNENCLNEISNSFDLSEFSDEYCKFGEFTGTFAGIMCYDSLFRNKTAYFDYFELKKLSEPEGWQYDGFNNAKI
ncbi:MAG: glycoside hydrolase family 43 protein [Eubacterium sp.]